MKLRLMTGSMMGAFLAGAALVHCGTTDFAAATPDGGSSSSHSSSSGSSTSSKASTSGTGTGSSSSSAESSSSGVEPCLVPADCALRADVCCANGSSDTGFCAPSHCPAGYEETCATAADCAAGVCCVNPALSVAVGLCVSAADCVSPHEEKCGPTHACTAGYTCEGEVCSKDVADSGAHSDSGHDGGVTVCVPQSCPDKCGSFDNGCTTVQCMCKSPEVCPVNVSGSGGGGSLEECCRPYTCAHYDAIGQCGSLSDNCGGTLECTCPGQDTCIQGVSSEPGSCEP